MIKKFSAVIFILFSFFSVNAQRNEIGVILGTSYYLGDLNPSKQFLLTKPAGGIIYRYILNERWAIKMNGLYANVAGNDAKAKVNTDRNLSFKSTIFEFSPQLELNFLQYLTGNLEKNYFTPYIFAGISVFSFNPKASYDGVWYKLKPLGTEGQGTSDPLSSGKVYSLATISFPFGVGLKYSVGKSICIGAEWGMRKTTTDYLDDVSTTYADPVFLSAENPPMAALLADRSLTAHEPGSQRGNQSTKDWYSFAGAFITIKFATIRGDKCPAFKVTKYKGLKRD